VPVGEDQKQHLEMTRDLAARFNNRYGEEFPVPDALIPETGARIMSLQDAASKMSRSEPVEASRVNILDGPDEIRHKLSRAVTDSGSEVRRDWDAKPGISNLIEILATIGDSTVAEIEAEYGAVGYGKFKEAVAEAVIDGLAPVRAAYQALDDAEVDRIMQKGALDARTKAEGYQQAVRKRVGLA
jgi:tryptophanyl-tRNA synthetase